jgi:S-adenosylmethionine decarboxylase
MHYFLAFVCGFLAKLTDNILDEPVGRRWRLLPYASGTTYGLIAGFLATRSTEFATLVIAVAISVLLAGKIDAKAHQLALASLFLFMALAGLPPINFALLAAFVALGLLDELLNSLIDLLKEKKARVNRAVRRIASARLSLELGTLAFSIVSGNFVYFFAVFVFDVAYNAANRLTPLLFGRFSASCLQHLVLDLYMCDSKKLGDKALLRRFLGNFPGEIGMRRISQPLVFEYHAAKEEDSGLSGFVLIAESHITIHTYPARGLAKIDVVSCKPFNNEKAAKRLKGVFNAGGMQMQLLDRGSHYPSEIEKAKRIVEKERRRSNI